MALPVKLDVNTIELFALTMVTLLISTVKGDGVCSDAVKGPQILADPDDCAGFYICHGGLSFRFTCESKLGPRKVFDPKSGNCVLKGSLHDNSKCNNLLTKPVTKCGLGSFEVFPHEDNCAKYYQCTGSDTPIILECPYPRLFDVNTGKCLIYLAVKCGTRRELKDPCEYESNQCEGSGCIPCRARFGTCIGRPNGPNPWDEKPWTPHFLICKDERVILQGDCRQGKSISIFNPYTRLCTPMSELLQLAAYIGL